MKTVLKTILGTILLPFLAAWLGLKGLHWIGNGFCRNCAKIWVDSDGIR